MEYPFAIVDVFATSPLGGNPLAVVAGPPSDALLPRIAREFNQSETTFVMPPTRAGADWRLRSFTAAGIEVFGAGHNALGAWWWLAATRRLDLGVGRTVFHQEIGADVLPVEVRPDGISMTQSTPKFGASPPDLATVASSLGLDAADLAIADLPAQVVSTGAAHLLVPVRDAAAVDRARVDVPRLLGVLRSVGAEGCYVFALGSAAPYARFFNPTVGLWEDPATGTAAGPLACYLVRYGRATRGSPIYVEQGHAMGRPSRIELRVTETAVTITGRGIVVAEGLLRL